MAPQSFMRTLLSAASLLLLATASPVLSEQSEEFATFSGQRLQRRDTNYTAVTGITGQGIQPRLEIRQLEQNADQWNIYLLGLVRFHQMNQTEKLSYYQIAGIHGRPYIPWDGALAGEGITSPGYCHHVSNLFLSWHRPYLALFEQTLYSHMIDVVNEFPAGEERERYAAAALTWRLPYWDWAAKPADNGTTLPSSITNVTVTANTPYGVQTFPNPHYSYRFHNVSKTDFYFNPFSVWNTTMRYPTSWADNAVSQNSLVTQIFDNNRVSIQDRLYNLFTNYNNYTEFSNEVWIETGDISNADSLESIHDVIHSLSGMNGHMTYLDYAAFDPIFWLHHVMIDRAFALWQALYPDSYVEPGATVEQTFTTPVGTIEDVNSALEPFHLTVDGGYWTSNSSISPETFGYTYADLGNGSAAAVKAVVNELYGSAAGSSGLSKRSFGRGPFSGREIDAEASSTTTTSSEVTDDGKYHEYVANIVSQKFALNGSYAIYVFLGDFDDEPSSWPLASNLAGTHAVFAALSGADAASDPQVKRRHTGAPLHITGSVPLTSMLLAKADSGDLASMHPDTVTQYLVDNLHWRCAMFDGTEVPVDQLSDLTVKVVSSRVQPAPSKDEFPQWGHFKEIAGSRHSNGTYHSSGRVCSW